MDLILLVVVLVVIGVLLSLLTKFGNEWMDPTIARILWWVIIIATVIWLLNVLGVLDYVRTVKVPTLRN